VFTTSAPTPNTVGQPSVKLTGDILKHYSAIGAQGVLANTKIVKPTVGNPSVARQIASQAAGQPIVAGWMTWPGGWYSHKTYVQPGLWSYIGNLASSYDGLTISDLAGGRYPNQSLNYKGQAVEVGQLGAWNFSGAPVSTYQAAILDLYQNDYISAGSEIGIGAAGASSSALTGVAQAFIATEGGTLRASSPKLVSFPGGYSITITGKDSLGRPVNLRLFTGSSVKPGCLHIGIP
jgi:hypothetical protein